MGQRPGGGFWANAPGDLYAEAVEQIEVECESLEAFASEFVSEEPDATQEELESAYHQLEIGERLPDDDDPFDGDVLSGFYGRLAGYVLNALWH